MASARFTARRSPSDQSSFCPKMAMLLEWPGAIFFSG
jgi:hypothetical protein